MPRPPHKWHSASSIAGGEGNDTLVLNVIASTFGNVAAEPRITGFENLALGVLADGTYNAAGFSSLKQGNTAEDVTYSNVAAGAGLTITATSAKKVDVVLADATGTSDVFNLAFTSTGAIDYSASSADITIAGVETINITTTDTDTTAHTNVTDLEIVDATTLTVTGNTGLDITINGTTGASKITNFDASGVTGAAADAAALAVTYASENNTVGAVITIKGGSGNDHLTGGVAANDTIFGGAGADTIVYTGGMDVFHGGAGIDIFDINALGTATVHVTIADLAAGDKIDVDFGHEGTIATGALGAKITLGAAATLANYLDAAAAAATGATNSVVKHFQFGGNTYLVVDSSDDAFFDAGDDSVVKISGLIDLSASTFNGTNNILTVVDVI